MIVLEPYLTAMSRSKEFDVDTAVDAAVEQFRQTGFEGTSAQMLVDAMGIGRQSLYDTFGDKWGLYCEALRRYTQKEMREHHESLSVGPRAIDGIRADLERTASQARRGCLGVNSVVEFADSRPEVTEIRAQAAASLNPMLRQAVIRAQHEGDIAGELEPDELAAFLMSVFSGLRIAARGGADAAQLKSIVGLALRAMR
jgi:AcrR family transcriptional regulator